jgi:hypothetical protein
VIDVGALGTGQHETWVELMALAERHPLYWTLIGAQMVVVHAAAAGRLPPRSSDDADVLVNVRLMHDGTRALSQTLLDRGYMFDAPNLIAVGHRFRRGAVIFDVLGPDGMRDDEELITVPPARTVGVPGGTQALRRTKKVEVRSGDVTGYVPRPDLLGAILIKARAVEVDDQPDNQRQDLTFLLSLVEDPRGLREEMERKEPGWLRKRAELASPNAAAYRGLGTHATNAHQAFLILSREGSN